MKIFQQNDLFAAYEHAKKGGQALHLMSGNFAYLRPDTPNCFKGRSQLAHFFDQDKTRLITTARKLGVRVIQVEHEGNERQHIDLCGKPLERALEIAGQEQWERDHGLLEEPAAGEGKGATLQKVDPQDESQTDTVPHKSDGSAYDWDA